MLKVANGMKQGCGEPSCSSDDINKFYSLTICNKSIFLSQKGPIICSLDSAESVGCDNIVKKKFKIHCSYLNKII